MKKNARTKDTTHVLKKLSPGDPGTRRHTERYGDRLVCVRYRDDPARRRRVTTVELIVDERPAAPRKVGKAFVRVGLFEKELQLAVKQAGGRWDRQRQLWALPKSEVRRLRLTDRIAPIGVDEDA